MARNLQPRERVYVPKSRVGLSVEEGSAFHQGRILEVNNRSIRIELPRGRVSDWVATSAAHRDLGVLILRIGDYETETALLDPLAKSLLQYCRLLLPDDQVLLEEFRSHSELQERWPRLSKVYSHVLLVGHGSNDAIKFAVDGWTTPDKWDELIDQRAQKKKIFLSLACKTGYKKFGGLFSLLTCCNSIIAPFHSVHGAVASQFCQTFLAFNLLEGETPKVAFNHARQAVPGGSSFRLWQNGQLGAGPRK